MSICSPKPSQLLLSTPLSKTISEASPPSTPNKKPKFADIEQYSLNNLPSSPSKPLRFHPQAIKSTSNTVTRQSVYTDVAPAPVTLAPPGTKKSPEDIFNYKLTPDGTDERLSAQRSPLPSGSLLTPSPSPLGEVSPLVDESPEYERPALTHQYLKGATISGSYANSDSTNALSRTVPDLKTSLLTEHSDTLHEMIHSNIWNMSSNSSSTKSDNSNIHEDNVVATEATSSSQNLEIPLNPRPLKRRRRETDGSNDGDLNVTRPVCVPRHRSSKPKKPILTIPISSLNLIVGSSKGSLQDATIFATEINALADGSVNKLPVISNEWERVTIPVNSAVKENYKRMKQAIFGDDEASDSINYGCIGDVSLGTSDIEKFMMDGDGDTSVHSNSSDVALIRGFKFQSSSEASQEKCDDEDEGGSMMLKPREAKNKKAVRWAL